MPAFQNPFRRTGATEEEAAESAALVDDDEGEWLAYELHEWALESRSMLAQLLLAEAVVHSWQGTTLLAHGSAEQQVDARIAEVEAATNPELDPDQPQIAFEMDGWSGELQAQLTDRLGAAGVPHEFDADGDLVTAAASLDSEVSKDGGTFTDCTNEASEIATSSGIYTLALTATEMNADIVATITKTATAGSTCTSPTSARTYCCGTTGPTGSST